MTHHDDDENTGDGVQTKASKQPLGVQCGAKSKRSGVRCRRMTHSKTGKCHMHGGKSTGPPKKNTNAVSHGIYQTMVMEAVEKESPGVGERLAAMGEVDHLKNELAILRYKILRLLSPVERQMALGTGEGVEIVTLQVDEITKATAIEKLVDGIRKIIKDLKSIGESTAELDEFTAAMNGIIIQQKTAGVPDTE